MPSRTLASNKSSLFADGPSNLGGGADDHLPAGTWSGYGFRGAVRFALNWADVTRVTRATLRLRTSSQVHVGFSSAPDIYVRRITADWTANSASSSAEGGGGWSTSPTVYPGPAATTTGQASKRVSTSEGATVDVDVTTIVRAWAPASAGGSGAPNYGVLIVPASSGDVTEFNSYRASSGAPSIILEYDSDAPPVATATGPTGLVTTARPTLTGTGSDPDGDTITAYEIEVRQGSTVVYAYTDAGGGSYAHTPTSDLPSVPLTTRVRATAAGVVGAWSADRAFEVDRPAVMGAWSAPAASVAGTRRPVHTVAWSEPDGDVGVAYDIEVWATDGAGNVTGTTPIYVKTNQNIGLTAASVSHTPTVDLPGGNLGARVRVKSGTLWSAWSAWRFYAVVLTVPAVSWLVPETEAGFAPPLSTFSDPANTLDGVGFVLANISYAPPAGTTIATVRRRAEVVDVVGLGGPALGTVLTDAVIGSTPTGGTASFSYAPGSVYPGWLTGTIRMTFTVTAANSGQTIVTRLVRFALGEWTGAVALGDAVAGLAAVEVPKGDDVAILYRAQSAPTVAVPGALWQPRAGLATVEAALPATNAYLGVRTRIARRVDDPQLITNPSFEDGLTGWVTGAWGSVSGSSTAIDGQYIGRIGDVATSNPSLQSQPVAVIPGVTYRLSAWARRFGGTLNGRVRIDALGPTGAVVASSAVVLNYSTAVMTYAEGWYTIPADGSVASVRVLAYIVGAAAVADVWGYDMVCVHGMAPGDAGLDRLELSWRSLG